MGLFDIFKGKKSDPQRSAMDEAASGIGSDGVSKFVGQLVKAGIEGAGPLPSAKKVADEALQKAGNPEAAIDRIVSQHTRLAAVGGFATGLGGFVTMPVALPANVLEFYLVATRMVAATAAVRGYDVDQPQVQTAVLLTLTGAKADEIFAAAGVTSASSGVAALALRKLPAAALMMVNKAIGFRLLRNLGEKALAKLGKGVPVAGGLIGAGLDAYLLHKIAKQARKEFPAGGASTL